jgi:hypothetical protein
MVQVDVFWSYAIGATFAGAAHRQLADKAAPLTTEPFVKTLLFLSALFAPSGMYLLWRFPGWETMFAGDRNLPAWLVALFAITNVTQGVVGFYVAYALIRRGRIYWANLQWALGYFCMFFVLVHGWDGTGYKRFLYPGTIEEWRAGVAMPPWSFATSAVAATLFVMGLVLLPIMAAMATGWLRDGYRHDERAREKYPEPTMRRVTANVGFTVCVLTLGAAIAASVLIHLLGKYVGGAVFLGAFYYLAVRPDSAYSRRMAAFAMDDR